MSEIKTLGDLAGEARAQGVPEIDSHALAAELEGSEQPIVIDVREPQERDKGYIPTSIGIPRGVLERDVIKVVFGGQPGMADLGRRIVCYCGGGSRSLLAAQTLRKMGLSGALSLSGGWRGWCESGGETAED